MSLTIVQTVTNVDLLLQEIICFEPQHDDFIAIREPAFILGKDNSTRTTSSNCTQITKKYHFVMSDQVNFFVKYNETTKFFGYPRSIKLCF